MSLLICLPCPWVWLGGFGIEQGSGLWTVFSTGSLNAMQLLSLFCYTPNNACHKSYSATHPILLVTSPILLPIMLAMSLFCYISACHSLYCCMPHNACHKPILLHCKSPAAHRQKPILLNCLPQALYCYTPHNACHKPYTATCPVMLATSPILLYAL